VSFTQEDKDSMDIAAAAAEQDLEDVDDDALAIVATWWRKWYISAGHKRLARILLQYAPKDRTDGR